jgi:Cu-processing system ATP-binding protein
VITVNHLQKSFGKSRVLDQLSLELYRGQSIALVGPNGSGKTTFIKCLLGLVIPDNGEIIINDAAIRGAWMYRNLIGYMPQIGRYPDNITVKQLFEMLNGIRKDKINERDTELMESFAIPTFENKTMRSLSGGTRQKVSACLAFLFNPQILILDEPTAGLDPVSAEILKEKVIREQQKGKLILITSHILSDLEEIASEVLFLNEGKKVFFKKTEELKKETGSGNLSKALASIMQHENYIA